jgi:hypothetical protein
MAAVADFRRYVLTGVDGAPLPAIDDAVVDACVEWCTRTRVLTAILDPITLVPAMADLELDPPDGDTQITEVMTAWLPEGRIGPLTKPELNARYPLGWAHLLAANTREVEGYYCRLPGWVRLVPMVSVKVPRALIVEVAYAPRRTATAVEDVLLDRYAEQIALGALARLHAHKAAYADPSRAGALRSAFDAAVVAHANDAPHGYAHKPMRTARDDL